MTKRLTSARHVLFKHGDTYDTAWKKVSSSRRGEAGLQLKIRIFSTYSPLVFRKHNEMLQEVIRNYKIIDYLNKWHTESYIKLQQLQHFSSEKWMRAKTMRISLHIKSMTTTLCFWSVWWTTKLIDRYKAFARYHFTLGSIAEDGHVFRKIKTAETIQSPRQSTWLWYLLKRNIFVVSYRL